MTTVLMSDVSQSRGSWRRLGGSSLQSDCQKPVPTAGPRSGAEKQAHLPLGGESKNVLACFTTTQRRVTWSGDLIIIPS